VVSAIENANHGGTKSRIEFSGARAVGCDGVRDGVVQAV
jgi:hypothetical protein